MKYYNHFNIELNDYLWFIIFVCNMSRNNDIVKNIFKSLEQKSLSFNNYAKLQKKKILYLIQTNFNNFNLV